MNDAASMRIHSYCCHTQQGWLKICNTTWFAPCHFYPSIYPDLPQPVLLNHFPFLLIVEFLLHFLEFPIQSVNLILVIRHLNRFHPVPSQVRGTWGEPGQPSHQSSIGRKKHRRNIEKTSHDWWFHMENYIWWFHINRKYVKPPHELAPPGNVLRFLAPPPPNHAATPQACDW